MTSTAVHDSSFTATRQARRISTASSGLVILLLAQYVLGIACNLYGTAPTASKTIKPFSSPLLGAHVVLGTLLIVIAIYLVAVSIRASMRIAVVASIIGLASLITAWLSGSAFTQKGASGYSMAMGVLTAVALLCYMAMVKVSGMRNREVSRPHAQNLAARERPTGHQSREEPVHPVILQEPTAEHVRAMIADGCSSCEGSV